MDYRKIDNEDDFFEGLNFRQTLAQGILIGVAITALLVVAFYSIILLFA